MNNIQSFSQNSDEYARRRPVYPPALFDFLAHAAPRRARAWDCATGNGQAAVACAAHFAHVDATDLSLEQVHHAAPHPRVHYAVSAAEHTPFEAGAFDLIMVAQAIHWFDRPRFDAEAARLLRPGGVLAAWGYGLFEIEPALDAVIKAELLDPIDPFWAGGNRMLMNRYRDLYLPFDPLPGLPDFEIQVAWSLSELAAYLRTWSAVKRSITETGLDPVTRLETALLLFWGDPSQPRRVRMPIFFKASRRSYAG